MPSILVFLLLLLLSIILFDAIPQYLIALVTILSMILPSPVPPVYTRPRMPEPGPCCSSRPGSPNLNHFTSYQTPDLESTLEIVPKKIPSLTCPATDKLASHTTDGPHSHRIRPNTRLTIQPISSVPGLTRIDNGSDSETYFDAETGSDTDFTCANAEVQSSLNTVAIGTPGNLGLASLDAESDMDTYFDTNNNILTPLSALDLMSKLHGADLDTRKAAASTLKCLFVTPEAAQLIATSCLRPIVDLIFSGEDAAIFLAAGIVRNISAALPEKHRQVMADARVIPAMVEILSFCNIPCCRRYAVETLCNLTRGSESTDGIRRLVVVEGGFKRLIQSLSGSGPYEVEAETLRHIAPAAPVPLLLSQGIVPHMVHVLRHGWPDARQVVASTIPSLPRSNRLQAAFGKSGAIHLLSSMLEEDLASSREAAAKALCCLLQCNKNVNIVRRDPDCIAGLVRMLSSSTARTGLMSAIGSLLYIVPIMRCREEMLAQGVIEALKDLEVQVPGARKLLQRLEGGSWMGKLLCLA